jgi:hypothetical protein
MFASSKRGLVSLTCCSEINTFCWWNVCIYSASQQISINFYPLGKLFFMYFILQTTCTVNECATSAKVCQRRHVVIVQS